MFPFTYLAAAILTVLPPPNDLKSTLTRLDASSATFHNAEAKVHRESYNALIKDIDDRQDGSIYVIRKDGKSQVGIKTEGKNARTVEYKDGVVRDYTPGINCYNTVNKPGIDTYLSLGFGGSGQDLDKVWNIADLGPSEGDTEKLDLTPKDAALKANVTHVTIWIDLKLDVTRKLIFYSPSGDYNTATYSNIVLNNKSVKTGDYAIKGKPCS